MKKVLLLLCLGLFFCSNVNAYVKMDDKAIERAQEYGIMNYQKDLPVFATPWVVHEEKSKSLDEFGEKIYMYTPYYLVAVNARERLLASQTINVIDGNMIIDAFGDALPVCVVLYVKDVTDIQDNVVALMRQKGELLEAYAMDIQDIAVVQTMVVKEEVFPIEIEPVTIENEVKPVEDTKQEDAKDEKNADVKDKDKKKEKEEKKKKEKEEKKKKEKDKDKKEKDKDKKEKDKDKKADDKKDNDKQKGETDEGQKLPEQKKPEPVYIEKTVPSLHRVQLFVYFDKRHVHLYGQATLLVDLKNEHERRFNFSFDSIQ